MYRFSSIRHVVYRYSVVFVIVLAVVVGKNAGNSNTKRTTTTPLPPTTTREEYPEVTSPGSSKTITSTKANSNNTSASSTNTTGISAQHNTSTPASITTTSATSTTSPTVNQQTRTSPGPGPVVKLSVEILTDQFGSSDIELSARVMKLFQGCLCNPTNTLCKVTATGVEESRTGFPNQPYVKTYICFLDIEAVVLCKRVTDVEPATVCEKDKSCAPDFTIFGSGCPLESVNIYWRKDQKLYVDLWKSEVNSFFICNASCWNNESGSGDDDGDADDDDDSVNPIIIGVVVSLGVVLVIIFLTIIVFMVHSKRKASAGQRYASSAQSLTSNCSHEGGHPPLDTPRSSIETSDQEPHSHVGYSIQPVGVKRGRFENDRSANEGVRSQDPGYAYIDDCLVNGKNEYATLDEALQYRHVYNRASSQSNDPKLRPPLPLPKHTGREPLPYYSVARTFSESEEPGMDSVSGQYLELIGDTSSSHPQSEAKPADVVLATTNINLATSTASDRITNDYFELEKESVY